MNCTKIIATTKNKSYPIYFGNQILFSAGKLIKKNIPEVKKIIVVCDSKIPSALLKKLTRSLIKYSIKIYKVESKEKIKSLKFAESLIEKILKDNLNRSDCIIAFGGGIVGDLTAFIASILKRGVKFVNIPTTLLAQVDSSIGGKTAVNSNQGKNLIGTFFQPDIVITDVAALNSLRTREMICGYGEILKHALISNKKFFSWLSKNSNKIIYKKNRNLLKIAIVKSCKIKSKIVKKDENEKNLRKILNFGHTFAHGFEAVKNFSNKLNHGEAVLLGMMVANKLAYEKNLLNKSNLNLIKNHYISLNLPINMSKFFKKNEINKIISYMKRDKKNINEKINLILLNDIGKTTKPNSINISGKALKKFLIKNYT